MRLAALALVALGSAPPVQPTAAIERPAYRARLFLEGRSVAVALETRGGFHINADYPIHFQLEGRRVERAAFRFTPCAAEPAQSCAAQAPIAPLGPVSGTFAFSVCDPERCLIEKAPLRFSPQ